mgnify:CR=1 FL=1
MKKRKHVPDALVMVQLILIVWSQIPFTSAFSQLIHPLDIFASKGKG